MYELLITGIQDNVLFVTNTSHHKDIPVGTIFTKLYLRQTIKYKELVDLEVEDEFQSFPYGDTFDILLILTNVGQYGQVINSIWKRNHAGAEFSGASDGYSDIITQLSTKPPDTFLFMST